MGKFWAELCRPWSVRTNWFVYQLDVSRLAGGNFPQLTNNTNIEDRRVSRSTWQVEQRTTCGGLITTILTCKAPPADLCFKLSLNLTFLFQSKLSGWKLVSNYPQVRPMRCLWPGERKLFTYLLTSQYNFYTFCYGTVFNQSIICTKKILNCWKIFQSFWYFCSLVGTW